MSENLRYFFDAEAARSERREVRQWITIIVLIVLLVATNIGWVIYENQFQDVVITQDGYVDGDGENYLNGMGEMTINGEQSEADD